MTLDALAFDMRSAHHLAATAKAHGNVAAWRKWTRIEHAIRGLIASGRTDLGGGSPSHSGLPSPAGDLGATTAGAASPPPTLLTALNGTAPRPSLSSPGLVAPSPTGGPFTSNVGQSEPGGRVAHDAPAEIAHKNDARTGGSRWGV